MRQLRVRFEGRHGHPEPHVFVESRFESLIPGLFALGARSIDAVARGSVRSPVDGLLGFGRLGPDAAMAPLPGLLARSEAVFPVVMEDDFEGCPTIQGGLWRAADVGVEGDAGLAKLRFMRGTTDLPAHVHEHSDRCLFVSRGRGVFHFSSSGPDDFDGSDMRSRRVAFGDVVVFRRGLVHTFSAPDDDMELLSFHSPAIAFGDPRQYRLPAYRWVPGTAVVHRPVPSGASTSAPA